MTVYLLAADAVTFTAENPQRLPLVCFLVCDAPLTSFNMDA